MWRDDPDEAPETQRQIALRPFGRDESVDGGQSTQSRDNGSPIPMAQRWAEHACMAVADVGQIRWSPRDEALAPYSCEQEPRYCDEVATMQRGLTCTCTYHIVLLRDQKSHRGV
jgi:hypothetical protein